MTASIFTTATARKLDKTSSIKQIVDNKQEPIKGKRNSQMWLDLLEGMRTESWPRYEEAYKKIQEMFPDFSWETFREKSELGLEKHGVVFFWDPAPGSTLIEKLIEAYRLSCLRENGYEPFKRRIKVELGKFHPNVRKRVAPLLRDEDGLELAHCLVDIGISYPPLQIMEKVADWYYRALEGEESTVVTPLCPDYETQETGDPSRPVVYTFQGVGSGVGYVAQRALRFIPHLYSFLQSKGIKVRFVAPIGDFEATEETCKRVGVTREEFIRRLRESQKSFLKELSGLPVEAPLVTEIDSHFWNRSIETAREMIAKGSYGALNMEEEDVERIASKRASLYQRWYGNEVDCVEILKRQAPEYMAMGGVAEQFSNPFIFGADHYVMYPFVHMEQILPALCLRNANY